MHKKFADVSLTKIESNYIPIKKEDQEEIKGVLMKTLEEGDSIQFIVDKPIGNQVLTITSSPVLKLYDQDNDNLTIKVRNKKLRVFNKRNRKIEWCKGFN